MSYKTQKVVLIDISEDCIAVDLVRQIYETLDPIDENEKYNAPFLINPTTETITISITNIAGDLPKLTLKYGLYHEERKYFNGLLSKQLLPTDAEISKDRAVAQIMLERIHANFVTAQAEIMETLMPHQETGAVYALFVLARYA